MFIRTTDNSMAFHNSIKEEPTTNTEPIKIFENIVVAYFTRQLRTTDFLLCFRSFIFSIMSYFIYISLKVYSNWNINKKKKSDCLKSFYNLEKISAFHQFFRVSILKPRFC